MRKFFSFLMFQSLIMGSVFAQVGVGTATPDASAKLEVSSSSQGFLPPRMTTTQRDAISAPADGLIIYNTTKNRLEIRSSSAWQTLVTLTGSDSISNKTLVSPNISTTTATPSAAGAGTIAYSSSSGGVLQYSNGTAWNTLTSTVQKSVVSGYFSSASGTGLRIVTCTETQDRNNDFSNSVFTAPRTGLYLVTCNLLTSQRNFYAGEELSLGMFQVGTTTPFFLGEFFAQASVLTFGGVSCSGIVSLTAGQQVNFQSYNGGSYTLYGQYYNQFSIAEL